MSEGNRRIITVKYASECNLCKKWINVGDQAVFMPQQPNRSKLRCLDCNTANRDVEGLPPDFNANVTPKTIAESSADVELPFDAGFDD